ncbi:MULTISPECIES: hypothetical protein [Bradyrhizobium]|uniref:hypothetical protein n=1 Tax=Bradyrhizobium TaxID=374 RepID=UPI00155E5E1C|nr:MULTISPECIES: hypothetical protein [Bradyrhizobium]
MTDPVVPAGGPEPSAGTNPAPADAPAGHASPQPKPGLPAFASKANDLDALRGAVVDAANVSAGLWLSYLFVLLYLAIAAGSVTHRDLLFEKSVKLPFLNVELPLVAFFIMGPALFLVVHAYVLLHFMLLADKAGAFHQQLRLQIDDDDIRASLRRQLPSNVFVQFVAGPPGVRSGGVGLMFRLIAQISLIVLPIGLLMLFQLQFLAYHSEQVTWWQRVAVVIDLALIWAIWPSINRGRIARLRLRNSLRWPVEGAVKRAGDTDDRRACDIPGGMAAFGAAGPAVYPGLMGVAGTSGKGRATLARGQIPVPAYAAGCRRRRCGDAQARKRLVQPPCAAGVQCSVVL